jgi:hypothetical protein
MKLYFLAAILVSGLAQAGILAVLVKTEMKTSTTGKLYYECTYQAFGNYQTIQMAQRCPPTMQFD